MVSRNQPNIAAELDHGPRLWQFGRMTDVTALTQGSTLPSVKARRLIREAANVSQIEMAVAVGVSRWSILRWETDQSEPRGNNRRRYAGVLAALREVADG